MSRRAILLFLGTVCFMFLQGVASAAGRTFHSVYTPLQKCRAIERRLELPDRTLERSKGAHVLWCPGIFGYSLYIVDDGSRSWLVLEHKKRLAPLERQMVGEFKLGNFPNVAR